MHWVYLGLFWGLAVMAGLTYWLVVLRVPSPAFCWMVWAILGQSSGAYVGPTCSAVLFLAGAAALLHQRSLEVDVAPRIMPAPVPAIRSIWSDTLTRPPKTQLFALAPVASTRPPVARLGVFPPMIPSLGPDAAD